MPDLTPAAILLGAPPTSGHQPDPVALAQLLDWMLTQLATAGSVGFHDTLADLDVPSFTNEVASGLESLVLAMRRFARLLDELEPEVEARADQRRQRGSITVILSLATRMSQPGQFTATVLHGATESLVRTAALELAPRNIRVNAIAALRPREEKREGVTLGQRTPLGRTASADEIAAATLFLAEDKAAIITGETLVMDGGRSFLSGVLRG